jgi:hypothetical protein
MKISRILSALLLIHLGAASLRAAAPAGFGDSFLTFTVNFPVANGTGSGLFYFGSDGTFRLVSLHTVSPSTQEDIYAASANGTYTYAVSGDDPNQGTLSLTLAQPAGFTGYFMTLEFAGPSTGAISYSPQGANGPLSPSTFGQGTFSQLVHEQNNFLVNVSNRVTLRSSDTAITGFVAQGTGERLVLVRVDGPSLAQFGVNPVSEAPRLALFQGTGTEQIGTGQEWDSGGQSTGGYDAQAMSWIFSMAGAFPLSAGSGDVAYFGVMSPGIYTAQASDPNATAAGGSALIEVFILPYSG